MYIYDSDDKLFEIGEYIHNDQMGIKQIYENITELNNNDKDR